MFRRPWGTVTIFFFLGISSIRQEARLDAGGRVRRGGVSRRSSSLWNDVVARQMILATYGLATRSFECFHVEVATYRSGPYAPYTPRRLTSNRKVGFICIARIRRRRASLYHASVSNNPPRRIYVRIFQRDRNSNLKDSTGQNWSFAAIVKCRGGRNKLAERK